MTQALANGHQQVAIPIVEAALVRGDLKDLTPEQRIAHYRAVCESLGLNPLTRPFQYIEFNGALQLYARKEASDQLAMLYKVNRRIIGRERTDEDLQVVTVECTLPSGRTEESIGAVNVAGLKGDALANALMKADTKAKRRGTLAIVGLGWLDETEVETIRGARYVEVSDSGAVLGSRPVRVLADAEQQRAADDSEAPRRHFWVVAQDLADSRGFTTTDGRFSKRAVHRALGVPEEDGGLVPYAAAYGWDTLRHWLEDGDEAPPLGRPDDVLAPDVLPDSGDESLSQGGFRLGVPEQRPASARGAE